MAVQQFRGGINELMKQAAWLQRKVDEAQKANKDNIVTATGANEKVSVTATFSREIKRIDVDPEFFASDRELALDAIAATVNSALKLAAEEMEKAVAKHTGGLKLPGLV